MDLGSFMIEVHADVWITLCRFNNRGVERCASDRINTFFRINIVRAKMQLAGSIVNHACRNRQIDRAPADDVSFAGVSAPLVKIHFVSASSEICREQAPRQSAADQNKFCHSPRIYESGTQESRKDCETDAVCFTAFSIDALQFLERVAQVI